MKKTLVLGASNNPSRYSYLAMHRLIEAGHEAIPLGVKKGEVAGKRILNELELIEGIDTITLYLNAERQKSYYDYILNLKPKRIIFNPGTENFELANLAKKQGIEILNACTLVMLSIDSY